MTQRIFDIENEKDMQDLWDILPIGIIRIKKNKNENTFWSELFYQDIPSGFIKINWHDKTEITRPVDYEDMIGCVGWFWDNDEHSEKKEDKLLGILGKPEKNSQFFYDVFSGFGYDNFTPAKKSELKFWGE